MKVLWLSNVIFPEACNELNISIPVVGGWMHSSAIALLEVNPELELTVVSLYKGNVLKHITKYRIKYYLVPSKGGDQKYNSLIEPYFLKIKNQFCPDVIHIHGSEYPHSLSWIKACGKNKVVVSIQGLVSIYSKYYLGGIPEKEIRSTITIRDIIQQDSIINQQMKMKQRGLYEIDLLKAVDHLIGRTSWDRAHIWAINPDSNYYFCDETLRSNFYTSMWEYESCIKNSIFLSQAHYPIKGIQQVIKALPYILRYFPDTMVYVAGDNLISNSFLKTNGFVKYLNKLFNYYKVKKKFEFLGNLNESEMVNMYLKSNVFICPSFIENSPNSIGEAQLIGIPCLASYVGGNMDMITNGETGYLYRFEETELLALRICELFANPKLAKSISLNGRILASERHNPRRNSEQLYSIYKTIQCR